MKKHWLRGMLLGVSLALLLAGGVALAQMTLTVDQDCFECWPSAVAEPDDEHIVVATLDDYQPANLCATVEINGELYFENPCLPRVDLAEPPCEMWLWVDCERMAVHGGQTCSAADHGGAGLLDAGAATNGAVEYGDWVLTVWQELEGDPLGPVRQVAFRFAEVCAVEFVPEPGTIALLGSGLAGLAGYATLRWKSRQ